MSQIHGKYCVIIPAYEAAKTIGELVGRVVSQGLAVIVVDDGSRDATASIASGGGAVVISHLRNEGRGSALRTGFAHALRARYDGVVTMDSDGQYDPSEIRELVGLGERQHAGLVLGNRMANGIVMPAGWRWTNGFLSWIISGLIRQPVPDSQCGFRFIRREVLEQLSLRARCDELETELLLGAASRRWKIVSVPVRSVRTTGQRSHCKVLRDTARFLGVIARHALHR